jgi:uncharacterized protein (DUF2342 family)
MGGPADWERVATARRRHFGALAPARGYRELQAANVDETRAILQKLDIQVGMVTPRTILENPASSERGFSYA